MQKEDILLVQEEDIILVQEEHILLLQEGRQQQRQHDTETPDPVQTQIPSHPWIKYLVRGIPPSNLNLYGGAHALGVEMVSTLLPSHQSFEYSKPANTNYISRMSPINETH